MRKPGGDSTPERRRALFLAPEAPYPPEGGGALRAASLFEYLAGRYEVDVVVFRQPGAPEPAAAFPPGKARAIHAIDLPPHRDTLAARAARNSGRLLRRIPPLLDRFRGFGDQVAARIGGCAYDIAVVEHFWCAPYAAQVAPAARRLMLDLHNIESVLHERCARTERGPVALAHRAFAGACRKLEHEWLPRYHCLLTPSEQDARRARAIAPAAQVVVYPNALPPAEPPRRAEEEAIAFPANFAYHPNRSAVRFFASRIWPLVRAQWPGLAWRLIGKNPEAVRRFIRNDPRIQVSGPVRDSLEEIAAAKVVVVPLLAGSGTRLKIIEAWAAGRPVVSTSIGAEGLPARHGENILLANEPEDFARAVSGLLASPSQRARLAAAGRTLFESQFTWSAAWEALDLCETMWDSD